MMKAIEESKWVIPKNHTNYNVLENQSSRVYINIFNIKEFIYNSKEDNKY